MPPHVRPLDRKRLSHDSRCHRPWEVVGLIIALANQNRHGNFVGESGERPDEEALRCAGRFKPLLRMFTAANSYTGVSKTFGQR